MISTLKAHSRNPLCRTPTTHGQLVSELDTSVEENEGMLKRMKSQILFCACVWTATATAMCTSHSNCAYCSGQCSAMSGTCWNAAGDVLSQSPIIFLLPHHPTPLRYVWECIGEAARALALARSLWSYFGVCFLRCVVVSVCVWECVRVRDKERVCVCMRERECYTVWGRECVCISVCECLRECVCARAGVNAIRIRSFPEHVFFASAACTVHTLIFCVCMRACVHECVCLIVNMYIQIIVYNHVFMTTHKCVYTQCGPPEQGSTNSGNDGGEGDVNLGT